MADKKRLIVIDSNSIIHRAFHALPPLTTKKGEVVGAVYGFLLVLFKALKEFQPDFVVAAFDVSGPTFRHEKYKDYKAKRPKAPEELYQQIPKVKEILKSLDVKIFEKQGFEADDIIGTIAKLAPKKQVIPGIETIILSGDSDTLQLIDAHTKTYALRKGVKDTVLYDKKMVEEKYQGLTPKQLIDFKALKGDPTDNIPGVPGIGEKTAIGLIKEFGTLENLYQNLDDVKLKTKEILIQNKEQAFFSRDLVEINKAVPLDFNLKECQWGDYDKEKATQTLKSFDFYSLISRLP
ncbi:DNA polymerase I [subsurface metagenome]